MPSPGAAPHADRLPRWSSASALQRRRLRTVLVITLLVLTSEVIGGALSGSLALFADAGHTLTDAAGMALSLFAIWLGARPPTERRTFGHQRVEILAAIVNGLLLFVLAGVLGFEAFRRLLHPAEVAAGTMLVTAAGAFIGNGLSALLLRPVRGSGLNIRTFCLEVLSDLLGSGSVILAAAIIAATGARRVDAVASIVIAALILPRTWRLLTEAVDVLLEATPRGMDMDAVRRHILQAPGVAEVHDLHAWTITSGMNVVSAHVVLVEETDAPAVLEHLCACLADDFDIEHSTFQLETKDRRRLEDAAHA